MISTLMTLTLGLLSPAHAADRVVVASSDAGCTLYIDGVDLVAEGCNLHIRNGDGRTDSANGVGNLVVGYDEDNGDDKSGSHNVVVGANHTHSSYGTSVGGYDNATTQPWSAVVAGYGNQARATYSAVVGGYGNDAALWGAVAVGGVMNDATGYYAVSVGGYNNAASGFYSAVLGGYANTASNSSTAVCGGYNNLRRASIPPSAADSQRRHGLRQQRGGWAVQRGLRLQQHRAGDLQPCQRHGKQRGQR